MIRILKIVVAIVIFLAMLFIIQRISNKKKIESKMEAVKLTETNANELPLAAKKLIIDFLSEKGLDANEYYLIKTWLPSFDKSLQIGNKVYYDVYTVNLFRIGALEEMAKDIILPEGAAGGEGDDINIVYDKDCKVVLDMFGSE